MSLVKSSRSPSGTLLKASSFGANKVNEAVSSAIFNFFSCFFSILTLSAVTYVVSVLDELRYLVDSRLPFGNI